MTIEALWGVSFSTPFGNAGSGVVVFETGRFFGGDSMYYYVGDYAFEGATTIRGRIEVVHWSGPPMNIFGPIERLTLNYEGQMTGDTMQAVGVDPTNPQRQVTMQFRRLANLP